MKKSEFEIKIRIIMDRRMIVIVCAAAAMLAVIASVAVLRNTRQSMVLPEVQDMPMSSEVRTKPLEHKSMSVVESSGVSCSYAACVVCGADAAIANRYEARNDALRSIARRRDLTEGDVAALKSWLAEIPAVRGGTIAPDQLRQLKNTFIVAATLASRAAIRGGMREDDAFTLSDGYIQRVELLNDHGRIVNLQYNMILEFTEQVEKLKRGAHSSKLAADVASYIRRHLSEPISTERMAEELYMSRPYLSARFKKETGETLTDFILREKTEEAKRLLRWSDRSASAVAAYLGFSSHSHFIRVFKKYAGVTPNEWRERQ